MNPLLHRLAVVRRRYRLVALASGVLAVLAVVVGGTAAIGLVDYANHLPRLLRACALVGLLTGSGFLVHRLLIDPLRRRSDNLSLALRIEALHPELNDALASTIQFLEEPDAPVAGDPALRRKAIERATKQAASFDFFAILDYRFLGMMALGLLAALAVAGHFLHHEPQLSRTAVARLYDPFGSHPWTRIDVPDAVSRIAVGQPFRLEATVVGIVPPNVKLEIHAKNPFSKKFESRPDILMPVKLDAGKRSGSASTPLDVSQKPLEFQYRIVGGDGRFPEAGWKVVQVLQPPSFIELDGHPSPQISLHYPAYTQLPSPGVLSPGTRHLDMIQGTRVDFRAAVDRPLKSAYIELKPQDVSLRVASYLASFQPMAPLSRLAPAAFHGAFPWIVPLQTDESRTKLNAAFRPWIAGAYAIHLTDDNDLTRIYEADLRVGIDPLPQVHLRRPSVSRSYLPNAEIPVQLLAEDDVFAVRTVFLEYRRKSAQGDWLDLVPKRIEIYDAASPAARKQAKLPDDHPVDGPIREKRLDLAMTWPLQKKFKVGEIITLQAAADDFCDVFTPRLAGRSHEVEIRIVSPDDLARELDQDLAQVQQELAALKKIEDEAQKLLDEIPKDKHDQKSLDQAVEAAQKVKQVQERVGARPDEGLRDKLGKMMQTMKDNKLPSSDMQDQVRGLSQELDRLAQEDFPKLEQNLSDLRKDLAGAGKPKSDDKTPEKSPLDKSKETNKDIQKTLGDLAKSLDRWADLAQLKGQTRELMEKQKALAEETAKLKELADLAGNTPQARAALREEADRLAGQQKKLEQEAKDLVGKINQVKRQQDDVARKEEGNAEEGDKDAKVRADDARDASKKLQKAEGVAKQDALDREMNNAAEELRQNQPNAARQKQDQAARTLDRMAKALEGEKDDDIDRLRKKQKQAEVAQENLDKLKRKVDQAQKNQRAGGGPKDRQEQAQELRDAAEELREQARRLQRLQEPRAARELNRAAEKLEEAAKKLEAGQPAEADNHEAEAQEHLAKAQKELEHLQQELAREQLAQIGDRLKGLKERQDAAVVRTGELFGKVEAKRKWSRGLLETLESDRQSQAGLAKETQSLEEKLKGALVFEHILKKAGRAMDEASQSMAERKTQAKDWLLNDFDKMALTEQKSKSDETMKLQKLAADRLDRLLEAIKDTPPQPVAKKEPKKDQGKKPDGKDPEEPQGGLQAQDGIPPMAQLKALKAEQVEVHERTKDFARDNPNLGNLDDRRRRELNELTEEQGRLRQLFEQMTNRKEE